VTPAGTNTQLQVNPASVSGESVTLTATVRDLGGIVLDHGAHLPTGTVEFFDGLNSLGAPVGLVGDTATFTTSSLSGGSHTLSAQYSGDDGYAMTISSPKTHSVTKGATTSTLTQSVNPTVWGQPFTITDTVSAVAPAAGGPAGTVQFFRDATPIAGVALAAGVASTSPVLTPGTYALSAVYAGNTDFNGSTSNTLTHTVNKANTQTTLASTPSSGPGEEVTLSASVAVLAPGAGTPTGTVQFFDGATALGSPVPLSGLTATRKTAWLDGTHSLTARYLGDANFNISTSPASTHTVGCDRVVGYVAGNYSVPATGRTCIRNASIGGNVTVPAGARISIVGSSISGALTGATGSGAIVVCNSSLGSVAVSGRTSPVSIGSLSIAGCKGNTVDGATTLVSNQSGVAFVANSTEDLVRVTGTSGGPSVIAANYIDGALQCSSNSPAASNSGQTNSVTGTRSGECAAASF
jgi:large repetitive protein